MRLMAFHAAHPRLDTSVGQDERDEHEDRGDQLEVVRVETAAQRDRDEQPEEHRAHHRAGDDEAELPRPDQRLADDDAGESPHHHADAHLHVGEALILREQRAGERHQAVRQRQAEHDHRVHVDAERADHLRVVAGRLHRRAEMRAEEDEEDRRGQRGSKQREDQHRRRRAC